MARRAPPRDSVPSVTASPRPQHTGDLALDAIAGAVGGVSLRSAPGPRGTATAQSGTEALVTASPAMTSPGTRSKVTGVTLDSRSVRPGDLYAALPGARVHGAQFAAQAARSGAHGVLTDPRGVELIGELPEPLDLPILVVDDPRGVLGEVSALVYGAPADRLTMIGITGTNGKTTTAYLLEAALRATGHQTGLIGTIETRIGTQRVPSVRTTPEASDLHGLLAVMAERGCDVCCMEVSSHALALHRVDAVLYDIAIFTNLSQDHLDFHGSMEAYFEAKAELFTPARARYGIVCVDDVWGRELARRTQVEVTTLTTRAEVEADWRIEPGASPGQFALLGPHGARLDLVSCLPGDHNRTNTALAALALRRLGLTDAQIGDAIRAGAQVPGRMQRADLGPGAPQAYVDFAHTPEAVTATLTALRASSGGPLVAVLGAGGDRDPGKRGAMGRAAAQSADAVVVTDDNPRHEDPAAIRAAVAGGARDVDPQRVHEVPGRAEGIALALELAMSDPTRGPGVVAVLGKGHEQGQTIGDTTTPFDDAQVLLARWREQVAADPVTDRQVRA